MAIVTVEMLAETIFKNIIRDLHDEYLSCEEGEYESFDEYLWDNLADLGQAAYEEIGNYYGDADTAVEELL